MDLWVSWLYCGNLGSFISRYIVIIISPFLSLLCSLTGSLGNFTQTEKSEFLLQGQLRAMFLPFIVRKTNHRYYYKSNAGKKAGKVLPDRYKHIFRNKTFVRTHRWTFCSSHLTCLRVGLCRVWWYHWGWRAGNFPGMSQCLRYISSTLMLYSAFKWAWH